MSKNSITIIILTVYIALACIAYLNENKIAQTSKYSLKNTFNEFWCIIMHLDFTKVVTQLIILKYLFV